VSDALNPAEAPSIVISAESVESTIRAFTELDQSGDKRSMTRMARRLGKEQPALLRFASRYREEHGEKVGEAAVFYSTLVWAFYDRMVGKCPRLTEANISAAEDALDIERKDVPELSDKPIHERIVPSLLSRQPHVCTKLTDLIEEDVREDAMTEATATIIFPPTQVVFEAFEAALDGRRPGQALGPVVRQDPKVGRNEPCGCG
jgi:hypothetical protein